MIMRVEPRQHKTSLVLDSLLVPVVRSCSWTMLWVVAIWSLLNSWIIMAILVVDCGKCCPNTCEGAQAKEKWESIFQAALEIKWMGSHGGHSGAYLWICFSSALY